MMEANRKRNFLMTRVPGGKLWCLILLLVWSPFLNVWGDERAEGEEIRISEEIQVQGNRFFDADRLLSETKLKVNSPFSAGRLENGIEEILSLYEEHGFPYCQVSPSRFRVSENGGVCFSFLVEEGPQVKVKAIQLAGLTSTRERVILREMGTGVFGLFRQSRLEAGLRRIERLSYIEEVERAQLLAGDDPQEAILSIFLRERKNNTFNGVLGYAPGAGERRGALFGSAHLVFDNIFGTGRMMQWNWSRKDAHSSRLLFLYREPWALGLPPTLEVSLMQVDHDSTYLKLSLSSRILFNSTETLSWSLGGTWEKVVPGPAGERLIPDSRKYELELGGTLDLLDRRDNPRKGILYRMEISYARKLNFATPLLLPSRKRVSTVRICLDSDHLLPTLRTQAFFVGLHIRSLVTQEEPVPLSDQFELGGATSVRGYREGDLVGSQVAWTNVEYRFLAEGDSRLFLFADYGYFERKTPEEQQKSLEKISGQKLGYGFGLRIGSKAGLLGIDYGLGEGDGITQGMIHFSMTNRF